MPGSPTKPSRQAFGAKKRNFLGEAGDSEICENAEESNLIRHQLTALGLLGGLVKVTFVTAATTGGLALVRYQYAWDQDLGDGNYVAPAAPSLVRSSAGVYLITVPAFGTDELGNVDVPVVMNEAQAFAQDSLGLRQVEASAAGNVLSVWMRQAAVLVDTATTIVVRGFG